MQKRQLESSIATYIVVYCSYIPRKNVLRSNYVKKFNWHGIECACCSSGLIGTSDLFDGVISHN